MFFDPILSEDDEDGRTLQRRVQEISPETLRRFVLVALLVQVGLFAASLGAMLVAFRNQRTVGGALAVGGLVALALALAVYRRQRRSS